jgi:outer membrane protein OmpA-like peptidoglycan-associated protein
MGRARLLAILALVGLISALALAWLALARQAREEARRRVAEALADGENPQLQTALFRRARKADPTYPVAPCEEGAEQERRTRFKEAAASFQSCHDRDPNQEYALLGYARTLLRSARGSESYFEARSALRRFLEQAPDDPVASHDTVSRRWAGEMVRDLEELLAGKDLAPEARLYSRDEIRRILLRAPHRGSSRYDGPRVPLRLGFPPGEAGLSTAAQEQLREVASALRDGSLAGASIQIEGHTDSVEGKTHRARVEISVRRAEAAKRFLVRQGGVPAEHLSVTGLADDYPLQPNGTAEGSAANRRVELVNRMTQDPVQRDVRDPFGS